MKNITTPLTDELCRSLKAGDSVLISGTIYTARDAAHKRMVTALENGEPLPFDVRGQIVYYVGPCPAAPGQVIGPAGPTTSGRMDTYSPALLKAGLKGMLGKGLRKQPVIDAIREYEAVYLVTTGGAGALLSKRILKADIVAYEDLGPEAIYKLEVQHFPAIVAIDSQGNNLYVQGVEQYKKA